METTRRGQRSLGRGTTALGAVCLLLLGMAAETATGAPAAGIPFTIDGQPFHAVRGEVRDARVIPVEGSSVALATWLERDETGEFVPHCGISLDGSSFVRVTSCSYELGLRFARFDPLVSVPAVPPALAAGEDVGLYLVQFVTQPLEVFGQQITALGGTVRRYVAQFAYVVEMTPEARDRVAALPYVRWIGTYEPAYRLEEFMLDHLAEAETAYPLARYNIQVMTVEQKSRVAARIAALGGAVDRADAGKFLLEATLTPAQLFQAARWDEVNFVDRWSPLEPDMDIARGFGGANYLETVAGYTGQGVRGEVFDQGFNLAHCDFQSRPLIVHGLVNSDSHGASTSGIVFGDGTCRAQARGMLPSGQGIVADYDYFGLSGPNRYTEMGDLVGDSLRAVFQTSSVGSTRTRQYTSISAETDTRLFDFDFAACQSQSNAGNQDSRPEAWAKNMISGGGIYHYNTADTTDDCWCAGASIGPASDGRIKPTLSGFYDQILTTDCCAFNSYTTNFGGTSGATPIVCGHVGLFMQMWSEGIFGNPVDPEQGVFENRPHAATARAMLINTADQWLFSGSTHDLTRVHQGWGRPSVKNLYDLRNKMFIVNETDLLAPFDVALYNVGVEAGEPALKVTLVYTDPPGDPAVQTQHRVNDLTLKVTSPGGMVYSGNAGLTNGMWSSPSFVSDTKNTEENVFIQNPQPGKWTIRVRGDEIIEDSHLETPELDADFALVVTGTLGSTSVPGTPAAPAQPEKLGLRIRGITPDRPEGQVAFTLGAAAPVRLVVHDVRGRRVAVLHDGVLAAGDHALGWNGIDRNGLAVAPGVYFVRLEAGEAAATGKLVVMR